MTCIRVNTVSLATFIKLADESNVLGCSADEQLLNLQFDQCIDTTDITTTTTFDVVDSISVDNVDAWEEEMTEEEEEEEEEEGAVAAPAPSQAIDIPGAKEQQSAPRLERRVSFNLRENTVMQFPSNATIGKIAQACSKRRASLIESSANGGKSYEELAQMADRKAQALLPRGASSELFRVDDGFAMTALYVKRGHIRLLDHSNGGGGGVEDAGGRSAPVKGVLKPFTPSPINSTFLATAACSVRSKRHGKVGGGGGGGEEEAPLLLLPAYDAVVTASSTNVAPSGAAAAAAAAAAVAAAAGNVGGRQGKSGRKRKSRSKSRSGAGVDLASALAHPISVISHM